MNRTKTSSTTKKTKQIPPCEDVNQEFCQRTLSLLTSLFETPSIDEIMSFPPSKKVEVPPPEKKLNFNSNIVELRLRRAVDQQNKSHNTMSENISKRVDEMSEILRSSNVNLDSVFVPGPVERPNIPKYLENLLQDQKRYQIRKRKSEPLDMTKIQNEYQERLQQSKIRGLERFNKRQERMLNPETSIPDTIYRHPMYDDKLDYRKREAERKKDIEARRTKKLNFMKPEDYKKLVKRRKEVHSSSDSEYD